MRTAQASADCRRSRTRVQRTAAPRRDGDVRRGGWAEGRPPCKPVSVPVRGRAAAIHLERLSPNASSDLPGTQARRAIASPSIWSCSAWGLPCRPGYPRRGALLPHHFTLTPQSGAVSFLWHFPSTPPFESASRPLAGTLPCGDRTFLRAQERSDCPDDRPRTDYRGCPPHMERGRQRLARPAGPRTRVQAYPGP